MPVLSVLVINKAGGLVFHRSFDSAVKLENNEALRQASTFHALFCVAQELCPVSRDDDLQASGIQTIVDEEFVLKCFHTPTGVKFVLTATPDILEEQMKKMLQQIYALYVDLVLKNPFHVLDNVIQAEKFIIKIEQLVENFNKNPQ